MQSSQSPVFSPTSPPHPASVENLPKPIVDAGHPQPAVSGTPSIERCNEVPQCEDRSGSTAPGIGATNADDSSEEGDDSGDEDFSSPSGSEGSEDEPLTVESAQSTEESVADLSNFLLDVDLAGQVADIIQSDVCEKLA